ncbi:hypothetical protein [Nodularia sp. LEGE 04288]|uniref:hypothetical protein n=1 Tax=Nodularia sp. LEGE 04288 TaxID=1828639 RepID=UPI001D108D0D|nr:hypothetical protein [Nodularia sp. LEGE 04288]MCC2695388.1 hypothetical protein [Nodularia sp. LEGE 04288]
MDAFKIFETFFTQFNEIQKIGLNNWESVMSTMQNMRISNIHETFDKTVELQEDLIKSSLEFQEKISHFSLDTQRKVWDSYFKMLRRS